MAQDSNMAVRTLEFQAHGGGGGGRVGGIEDIGNSEGKEGIDPSMPIFSGITQSSYS